MDINHLYDLAYQFKRSRIWNTVYEEDIFAIRLGPHKFGYCCIMGRNGEHMALAVYPDAPAFSSLRKAVVNTSSRLSDLLIHDCIQCSIEQRNQLSPSELDEVLEYCNNAGESKKAPFPQFSRHIPYRMPWMLEKKGEMSILEKALEVVLALNAFLKDHSLRDAGLHPIQLDIDSEYYGDAHERVSHEPSVTVPVFSVQDGKLHVDTRIGLPPYEERSVKAPKPLSDEDIHDFRLMFNKEDGLILECEVSRMQTPIDGRPPFLPAVLFSVEKESGYVLYPVIGKKADYDSGRMLSEFVTVLMASEIKPAEIHVRTRETWTLFEDFCARAAVKLVYSPLLPALDEAVDSFNELF